MTSGISAMHALNRVITSFGSFEEVFVVAVSGCTSDKLCNVVLFFKAAVSVSSPAH